MLLWQNFRVPTFLQLSKKLNGKIAVCGMHKVQHCHAFKEVVEYRKLALGGTTLNCEAALTDSDNLSLLLVTFIVLKGLQQF